MKSIFFNTDEVIHKKFKTICAINDIDMGKTLTELMQKFVKENEGLISSPQVKGKLPPEIPPFYGEQKEWSRYVYTADKNKIENFATRVTFLRHLLHLYLIDKDNKGELYQTFYNPQYFMESDDYKFLQKDGTIQTIRDMSKIRNLSSSIRII